MPTLNNLSENEKSAPATKPLAQLLATVNNDLAAGMLSPQVMNDPDVHAAELDRIFTRCWVYVGHVSEIPEPGDYLLRYVGEDQFILARDENGEFQLMLNHCAHRGAPVCRAEKGNASHFRCPYHGWIYKNTGQWNGAPARARAYRKLEPEKWGLQKAPHIDTYHGLIFACLDPDAVSLREYLGDMAWYLDMTFGLHERGMEVAGEVQRWIVPGNWKSGGDNFSGDGYHITTAHASTQEIGVAGDLQAAVAGVKLVELENGHGVLVGEATGLPGLGALDYPLEVAETFDLDRLTDDQRKFAEQYSMIGFNVFPNLSMVQTLAPGERDGEFIRYMSLRQWQPQGPAEFEVWSWPMVVAAAHQSDKDASQGASVQNFGAAGLFEQDDTVAWSGGPGVGSSPFARRFMKLNYQMGLNGMSDHEVVSDWPGPGLARTTGYGEFNQRAFWQHWRDVLADEH
ncbi:ring hydroxylating enzyme alpha subunit [Arthrobacter sp. SLBN-100]|uniref:aromatic ring-hydroxylating oxygenase subunit alpha n=1 Tax=Arthrobacter sp. SLBN-100 TaxID=2768450 RepID=UPI00115315B6|nr:Rieske 2Fe-2S domain-containing protein [Arthrobacter sp. SLBN-100]TQJ62157.1 ring hydroxylating enzyme alpha subunit [Arthrobacter sp. SLBN-100]